MIVRETLSLCGRFFKEAVESDIANGHASYALHIALFSRKTFDAGRLYSMGTVLAAAGAPFVFGKVTVRIPLS